MTKAANTAFVETNQYHRFREFCDSCSRHRYIGICYGPPGVGKTMSARRYARWNEAEAAGVDREYSNSYHEPVDSHSIFYTPGIKCSPKRVEADVAHLRGRMRAMCIAGGEISNRLQPAFEDAERREESDRKTFLASLKPSESLDHSYRPYTSGDFYRFQSKPTLADVRQDHVRMMKTIVDPTRLVIIDEAERLTLQAVEQVRAIFDGGGIGVVFLGMPGLERSLARHAQLYSRVGFVHEFKPLRQAEVRKVLPVWPLNNTGLKGALTDEDAVAMIIRVTGGNFRLLHRLLLQIAEILEINEMQVATQEVVEAARECLVIGTN